MATYYRLLHKHHINDHIANEMVEVIKESFMTVAREFKIQEGTFSHFGAFYCLENLRFELSHGVLFLGAFDKESDKIIGCIGLKILKNKCDLIRLSVLPKYRHQGIGRNLMFEAECICHNHACDIHLGMIYDNKKLNDWYVSLGYKNRKIKQYKQSGFKIALMKKGQQHLFERVDLYKGQTVARQARLDFGSSVDEIDLYSDWNHRVCLVYSKNEVLRKTNTGFLVQSLLPKFVSEFIWNRNDNDLLINYLNQYRNKGYQPVLVFKGNNSINSQAIINNEDCYNLIYIILDGTWQEAKEIYNQCDYLRSLDILSLESSKTSIYNLRKNQVGHGFCTAEVVGLLMENSLGEQASDMYFDKIKDYIKL